MQHTMYLLNTLILLSGTLTAAHNGSHETSSSAAGMLNTALSSSARSTKTVIVTITHTLPSPDASTLSTSKTSSGFAVPPSVTEGTQAGAGWPASVPGLLPIVTELKTTTNSIGIPVFTLDMSSLSSTSVPFVGRYTFPNSSPPHSTSPHPPPSTKSSFVFITATTDNAESPTTELSTPSATVSRSTYLAPNQFKPTPALSSEETDATISMLPVGDAIPSELMPGFKWPSTAPSTSPTSSIPHNSDNGNGHDDGNDDEIAWAGADNAIPAQMHHRSPPHLSSPPLQSQNAAVRRVRRVWARNDTPLSPQKEGGGQGDTGESKPGKRECRPCTEEGKVLCRGDVAVGICRGGCEELQFLGRGQGNGCEDD